MAADYIIRLRKERAELKDRLVKLNCFLSDINRRVDGDDFCLLCTQYSAMQTYLGILNLRIGKYENGVERKDVK